jgi:broad specificity phosphatase PhoE
VLAGRTAGLHLTSNGRNQAECLARHLASEPINHLLSSPIDRARETAAPLAKERRLTVEISEAVTEIDAGAWTGKTFAELDHTEAWRQFNRFRSATLVPGGESMVQVQERFVGEMIRLRDEFPNDGLAIVSHADPIKIALACFLGAPLDFYDRLEISLGSVSVLTLDSGSAKVLRLNEVPRVLP